ncbi:MFS transporter [Malikia granosa]|uniref:MFS transporter n=1 Tax=Malikia granosa TaxID=263067 RepID=A0A2S9K9B0_9BURK|nr:MFS transporter [Malikia granosa]PRD66997.1 MFS transporter [Malikia granosa]
MTAGERRASVSLAAIFALRMLGLFLVLPVFALEARRYPGGDDSALVGLAMGIYGLTQALLQIPLGIASDRWGRKPVILLGLALFALGSAIAAWAPSVHWLVAGRAIQGAGAISAAVTAFLADVTRDSVRTKAMALVGISIALMFALSLVLAPLLAAQIGLHGLFGLTAALALTGMALVAWVVPPEPALQRQASRGGLRQVLAHAGLLRLDFGVFALHAVQLSMWMAVPALLVQSGLAAADHWQVYLPAVLLSFLIMGGLLFRLERKGYLRAVFLVAIGLILLVQLGFLTLQQAPSLAWAALLLCLFFTGFNMLEASQPSLVSRLAPHAHRGAALGVYNTLQSLGFFVGGAGGGWLVKAQGGAGVFGACAALTLLWLLLAWPMRAPAVSGPVRR